MVHNPAPNLVVGSKPFHQTVLSATLTEILDVLFKCSKMSDLESPVSYWTMSANVGSMCDIFTEHLKDHIQHRSYKGVKYVNMR